jgi:hypothetical protein
MTLERWRKRGLVFEVTLERRMRHMAIGLITRLMSYNGKNGQKWCGVSHGSSIIPPWTAGGILERLVATVAAAAAAGGTMTQQSGRCTPTVRFLFRSQWVELFSTLTMMSSRPSMRSSTQGPLPWLTKSFKLYPSSSAYSQAWENES